MSRYWELIAPVAVAGFGAVVYLAHRLRHPAGGHRADPVTLDATPDTLARWGTVPVAEVAGLPPWAAPEAPRNNGYGWNSGSMGKDDGRSVLWAELNPPGREAAIEAVLRRELHHVDDLQISGEAEAALPAAGANPTPGNEGAGDESEGSGLTAPPAPPCPQCECRLLLNGVPHCPRCGWRSAPLWEYHAQDPDLAGGVVQLPPLRPVDLALARCDLFMTAMRADHERWMSLARERWAAA